MGQIQMWTNDNPPKQLWVDDITGLPLIKQPIITEAEYRENMFDIYESRIEQLEAIVEKLVGDIYEDELTKISST